MINLILVIALYFTIGIVITIVYELLTKNMCIIIFGYQFHHSIFGLIFIVLGLLAHSFLNPLYSIFMGIGIIVQHTINEKRFVFID